MNENEEIKREILQLEFQHKKEMAEIRDVQSKTDLRLDRIARQLDHITQLTGFAFEELQFNDKKLKDAGEVLSREKQT